MELSPTEATYRSLLGKLMEHDSEPLVEAYGAIEGLLGSVQSYVKVYIWVYMGYICTVYGEGSSKYNRAVCKLCM